MWPLRSRRRYGQRNMGVMLICLQLFQAGIDRIPPVTLGTIALNVGVYLGLVHEMLNMRVPSTREVCIGVGPVWRYHDYSRLYKAAFFHADDWHLYYNMASFLYKGIYLEKKVGSAWFLYMLAVFTASVNVLILYLDYSAAFLLNDPSYLAQCAVGFSGVIFAVKVVTTHHSPPGTSMLMGFIPVNSRYACWFELALIQVLVPNASFTGHLAGILVGLAYAKGPLKNIMKIFSNALGSGRPTRGPSYTYRAGTASQDGRFATYTAGMDENEQMTRAMNESMRQQSGGHTGLHQEPNDRLYPDLSEDIEPSAPPAPPPPGWNIPDYPPTPSQEEIRNRRLHRFENR